MAMQINLFLSMLTLHGDDTNRQNGLFANAFRLYIVSKGKEFMIVIPMAGLSKRFQKSGFTQPKYMLEANGNFLFEHSLKTFEAFFAKEKFLFILNNKLKSEKFVEEKVKVLGINDYEIISLPDKPRGHRQKLFF